MRSLTLLSLALLLLLPGALSAQRKRLILVDDCNSSFVNNHEGYERALAVPRGWTKEIHIGGNLTQHLGRLNDGDELVIIAHGSGGGSGFVWGTDGAGMPRIFSGFGAGADEMPVPAGFAQLRNIRVRFCSCWSAADPDGAQGPDRPLLRELIDAMGGAGRGHTGSGYQNLSFAAVCFRIDNATMAEIEAAVACLKADPSWMDNPPTNRGGGGANQQTAAQAIVAMCRGAGGRATVVIPDAVGGRNQAGYKRPRDVNRVPGPGTGATGSCCGPEGCGIGGQEPVLPECWLLLAGQSASTTLSAEDTLWLIPDETLAWPVTMEVIPEFYIPQDPALLGLVVYAQVVMVNPEVFPNDPLKTSNGLAFTIGGLTAQHYGQAAGIDLFEVAPALLGEAAQVGFTIPGL